MGGKKKKWEPRSEGETTMPVRNVKKKITLLGDTEVGKTSLIHRYVYDVFDERYLSTFGAKITKKSLLFLKEDYPSLPDDIKFIFLIWDIAGQKAFTDIHQAYYRGAEGSLLVCDVTRRETLDNTREWITELRGVTGEVPSILLINKCDLNDQYDFGEQEANSLASLVRTPFYYTSAKTGHNVEAAFRTLAEFILGVR